MNRCRGSVGGRGRQIEVTCVCEAMDKWWMEVCVCVYKRRRKKGKLG